MTAVVEAHRQSALLAAVFGAELHAEACLVGASGDLQRGLSAYRANAAAIAERALAAAYPTVCALVGAEDFAALARALWRTEPPLRGDLAQWGHDLPGFIEAQGDLDAWPYLGDSARLDLALQRCEAAADAALERDTLALLAGHDAAALRLALLPCVQLLASPWPIATLHAAHERLPEDGDTEAAFAPVRAALAAGRGEAVVVARVGWRARPQIVDAPTLAWMQALQSGAALATALTRAGDDFDFNAWLVQALQQGWLWKAETIDHPSQESAHDTDLA